MKINQIAQTYGIDLQKAAGKSKAVSKTEKPKTGDSVSVSAKAESLNKSAAASASAASERIQGLPEVRWNRVEEVKQKIQKGFYNTPEFHSELADRLIKDFGL